MAQMPKGQPFSVLDPLADAWDAAMRLNRKLQAKNVPLEGARPAAAPAPRPASAAPRLGADRYGTGPLLGLIPKGEGTEGPNGYDMTFNNTDGKHYPPGWKKPTQLTVDEAIRMEPDARRIAGDYAIGKYQFKPDTMRELKRRMGLTGSEVMTPEMQDRMAETLLRKRGYIDFIGGRISPEAFQAELAKEWASLPKDKTDLSHYGDRARIPTTELLPILQRTKDASSVLDQYLDGGYSPP